MIWEKWACGRPTELIWIPPGTRKSLTKADDVELYANLGVIEDPTTTE